MRKIVAATLALALSGALAACGAKKDTADNSAFGNDAALNETVPADFWREHRDAGLVNPAAPLPV